MIQINNPEAAFKDCMELTKLAIEHDLIPVGSSAEETANNVYVFLQTLIDNLQKR